MADYKGLFTLMGAVLTLACYVPYFWGLYKKTLKPHMFSWLIWGVLMGIACAAQITAGGGNGTLIMGLSSFFSLAIAAYAAYAGEKHITRSDYVRFVFACASIPLWLATKNPLYAVTLISLIDVAAFWPTVRKSWSKPYEESLPTFALAACQLATSILALDTINLTTALYPATLVLLNMSFCGLLVYRRRKLKVNF